MISSSRHIIHEHLIQLEFESEKDARRWQQEIGPIVRRRLMPLFDRIFEANSTPDSLIRLDTLVLDLGSLDPSLVERQLEERLMNLLGPKLLQEIQKENQSSRAQSDSALELLSSFFFTGSLPWWANTRDHRLPQQAVQTLANQSPGELRRLILAVMNNEQALRRMLNTLNDKALQLIIGAWPLSTGIQWAILETALTQLARRGGIPERRARREWWKGVLFGLGQVAPPTEVRIALYGLWQAMSTFHWKAGEVRQAIREAADPDSVPNAQTILREWEALQGRTSASLQEPGFEKNQLQPQLPVQSEEHLPSTWRSTSLPETGEIFLDNAGLVLFWPFLQPFFNNAGLLQDKVFLDAFAPFKAALLLQYLADGSTEPPEYLLALNKVLCGIPLEESLPEDLVLKPGELDFADALLDAVVEHARPALGHISPEGLREAFIRRRGLLGVEDGQWLLRVERETHDILLDRLPWSFRVVKLPWMPRPLIVDW